MNMPGIYGSGGCVKKISSIKQHSYDDKLENVIDLI